MKAIVIKNSLYVFIALTILSASISSFVFCSDFDQNSVAREDIDNSEELFKKYEESAKEEALVTLYDLKSGAKLESAFAIASYDPRNSSRMHVGYFLPDKDQQNEAGTDDFLELCGFSKPENCKNEDPYPLDESIAKDEDTFDCGIDDESRPNTGFVCERVDVKTESDGDLAFEGDIAVPEIPEEEEVESSNRKLLNRINRSVGLRSRSLRSNSARGRIGK